MRENANGNRIRPTHDVLRARAREVRNRLQSGIQEIQSALETLYREGTDCEADALEDILDTWSVAP